MVNADTPREAIVEVRGLRSQFGAQVVHENLDLDVYRGEILGIVGGSGSGKSVLLRTILGLRQPAAGSVKLFGANLHELPPAKRAAIESRCGVLFQNGALFSSLTVSEENSAPFWNSTPQRLSIAARLPSDRSCRFSPNNLTLPACGRRKPRIVRSSTDLPLPEPPTTPRISPR
jgi:ABC-type transporter Mla maintaining outer membrane lipid asymmetry ATPase subunit MlaF